MGNSNSHAMEGEDIFITDCDLRIGRVCILEDVQLSPRRSDENVNLQGKPAKKHKQKFVSNVEARRVLRELNKMFQDNLHVDEIVPALFQENLLTSTEKEAISNPHLTKNEKVDKLLQYLTMKGKNMMHVLIQCLESSDDGTGHAHQELAANLEEKLGKRSRLKSPKKQSVKSYHPYAEKPINEYLKPKDMKLKTVTLYDTKPIETFFKSKTTL